MFILKAIRQLLFGEYWPYSLYLALGILLSHLAQIHVYHARGGSELATWGSQLGFHGPLSVALVTRVSIVFAIALYLALQIAFPRLGGLPAVSILSHGVKLALVVCLISNLIFSSIMRIPYELAYCLIPVAGILIKSAFIAPVLDSPGNGQAVSELWDWLRFITPLCIGLPIIMGGSGFIASFYKTEHTTVQLQLYRHIFESAYFAVGACIFLLYPLMKAILIKKGCT